MPMYIPGRPISLLQRLRFCACHGQEARPCPRYRLRNRCYRLLIVLSVENRHVEDKRMVRSESYLDRPEGLGWCKIAKLQPRLDPV